MPDNLISRLLHRTRDDTVVAPRWVAPSQGGYSAQSRTGETVARPATPPSNPASGALQHRTETPS